ncbi:hypothetical protein FOA52_010725 [Chlamydomonas sp. UWO 241]|nr:hypothetical protein FOA52_010725 [Chlamydomonas sp. UWO 241]
MAELQAQLLKDLKKELTAAGKDMKAARPSVSYGGSTDKLKKMPSVKRSNLGAMLEVERRSVSSSSALSGIVRPLTRSSGHLHTGFSVAHAQPEQHNSNHFSSHAPARMRRVSNASSGAGLFDTAAAESDAAAAAGGVGGVGSVFRSAPSLTNACCNAHVPQIGSARRVSGMRTSSLCIDEATPLHGGTPNHRDRHADVDVTGGAAATLMSGLLVGRRASGDLHGRALPHVPHPNRGSRISWAAGDPGSASSPVHSAPLSSSSAASSAGTSSRPPNASQYRQKSRLGASY